MSRSGDISQPRDRVRRELQSALKAALRKGVKPAFRFRDEQFLAAAKNAPRCTYFTTKPCGAAGALFGFAHAHTYSYTPLFITSLDKMLYTIHGFIYPPTPPTLQHDRVGVVTPVHNPRHPAGVVTSVITLPSLARATRRARRARLDGAVEAQCRRRAWHHPRPESRASPCTSAV